MWRLVLILHVIFGPLEGDGVLFVRALLRGVLPILRAGRRQRWPLEWRRPHEVRGTRVE